MLNDLLLVGMYLPTLFINKCNDTYYAFVTLIVCILFAYSPFFDVVSAIQVHLFYIIVNLLFILRISKNRIRVSMLLMVMLNIVMVWDNYKYGNIETWCYLHYARNTTLIHCVIILSLFNWRTFINVYNSVYVSVRNILIHTNAFLDLRRLSGSADKQRD